MKFQHMTMKQFFPPLLLIAALCFPNCASDNKKTPQPSPPAATAAPAPPEPASQTPRENGESPAGKSAEQLRANKSNRIGSIPTGKDAELNKSAPTPPTPVPAKTPAKAGPPGYITKKDLFLQSEPSSKAANIAPLKQYETVYILETIMKDENGNLTPYPTWYKVERENKATGWVVAKGVNAGGGG